jgi:diguanylate cyclase (GGDEF)-like protein
VQALKAQREENFRLAHEEPITGLPNRACLNDAFAARIEAADTACFAVVIFIPDNLAEILGSYGSVLSDKIMRAVAQRLCSLFSKPDTFYSMTGTDLVLLLSTPGNTAHTRKTLNRVLDVFRAPVEVDGAYFYISASCGAACYPADGNNREDLIMKANLALYQAKRDGQQIVFFSEQIGKSLLRRTRIRNALPKALENQEFELYFQPQVQALSDRLLGFEALLRWHSPDLGETSPLEFIGVAEESRLILPLGSWVLKNACMTLRQLNERYHTNYFMAVNVSGIQLFAEGGCRGSNGGTR